MTNLARAIWELRSQNQSLKADRDQDRRKVDSVDQTNMHLQVAQSELAQQLEATIDRMTQVEGEWATWVLESREAGPDGGAEWGEDALAAFFSPEAGAEGAKGTLAVSFGPEPHGREGQHADLSSGAGAAEAAGPGGTLTPKVDLAGSDTPPGQEPQQA